MNNSRQLLLALVALTQFACSQLTTDDLLKGSFGEVSKNPPELLYPRNNATVLHAANAPFRVVWDYRPGVMVYELTIYSDAAMQNALAGFPARIRAPQTSHEFLLAAEGSYFFEVSSINQSEKYTAKGSFHVLSEAVYVYCAAADTCDGTGSGTRNLPFRKINSAIAKAAEIKLPVFVAARGGTAGYEERIQATTGLLIYGGYEPTSWSRNTSANLTYLDQTTHSVFEILGAGSNSVIEGFRIRTPNLDNIPSIYALASAELTLSDLHITSRDFAVRSQETQINAQSLTVSSAGIGPDSKGVDVSNADLVLNNSDISVDGTPVRLFGGNGTITNSTLTSLNGGYGIEVPHLGSKNLTIQTTIVNVTDGQMGLKLLAGNLLEITQSQFNLNNSIYAMDLEMYDRSATIRDNTIYITGGSGSQGIRIANSNNMNFIIENNIIEHSLGSDGWGIQVGGSLNYGLVSRNRILGGSAGIAMLYAAPTNLIFANNLVHGGTLTTSRAIYVEGGTIIARNNTLYAGPNSTAYTIGGSASSPTTVENNIIFAPTGAACIREDSGANIGIVRNNNLYGCTNLYVDNGSNNRTAIGDLNNSALTTGGSAATASGNASIDNTANQLFVNVNGADGNINTMSDNDWRLQPSAPLAARTGGLNGKHTANNWQFAIDFLQVVRSPGDDSSTAGWSMGAYEQD